MKRKIPLFVVFILFCFSLSAVVFILHERKEITKSKTPDEAAVILNQEYKIENTEIYTKFLKNYNCQDRKCFYSFVALDGFDYPVLLLADTTYTSNEQEVTMCAEIYYPVDSIVTLFGSVCSGGTAYPIAADKTGIYTAGGHEVSKFSLDIQNKKLKLIDKYIMFFNKVIDKVNAITIGIIDGENIIVSEADFDKAYDEYGKAETIYFKHLIK